MKKYILFIVLSSFTFGQISEYTFSELFLENSIGKNNLNGIGNIGFDSYDQFYNPNKNGKDSSTLEISLSGNYVLSSKVKLDYNSGPELFRNTHSLTPNLSIKYNYNNFSFFLQYYNSLMYNNESTAGSWSFTRHTFTGDRSFSITGPKFCMSNQVLQGVASAILINGLSFSIGVSTNIYKNAEDFNSNFISELSTEIFDNIQYLVSLNYKSDKINSYFLYRTQSDPQQFGKNDVIKISDDFQFYNNSIVSFPGSIGYGIQVAPINGLKLSVEMEHEFLKTTYDYKYKKMPYESWDWSDKFSYNIFNNKIVLGINYQTPFCLVAGLAYSKYLKYDVNINQGHNYFPLLPQIDVPEYILFGFGYDFSIFYAQLDYQHSFTSYKNNYDGYGARKFYYNMIKVGLNYRLIGL